MISRIFIAVVVVVSFCANPVFAADAMEKYRVADAMSLPKVQAVFYDDVAFYWGDTAHPTVSRTFGTFKTSKRTNAFGKGRGEACAWAMASALVGLRDRAYKEGGNAVINIVSNVKNRADSSPTDYTCLAGSMLVNVALKGTVVTLAK